MGDFKPLEVEPGSKDFGYVNVLDNLAAKVEMPVGVVNGGEPGPTLIVTGGLYPTEYCGVEAASRLYRLIEPEGLKGRFITVPVVNMPVFRFRTRWLNLRSSVTPFDGLNINAVFPGDPNGTPTRAVAHTLFQLVKEADYHVDFRGGDLPESHLDHTIYLKIGKPIDETSEAMAEAFGLRYVLPGTPEIGHTSPGTLIYEAVAAGTASIISEAGLGYRTQPLEEFVMAHVDGTVNLLKHFGMLEGELKKPEWQRFLDMEWRGGTAPVARGFPPPAAPGDIPPGGGGIGRGTGPHGAGPAGENAPPPRGGP
ncbi:succinylglutamate desuccinylase/aspartoacylase family protein, partial [Candidatus Bathyarchaeota archaeon]|nr:succinylglutamate desuccinylase/aspartoacylase family protein [Candidatus Bathyarchaeota archaeon]